MSEKSNKNLDEINFRVSEVVPDNTKLLVDIRQKVDGDKDVEKIQKEAVKYSESLDRKSFLAQEGGETIGYVEVNLEEELPLDSPNLPDILDFAHIARVGVLENYRGRGIGGKLISLAEEWARASGKNGAWLDYLSDNDEARGLYMSAGYENKAEFKDLKKDKMRIIAAKIF